MIWRGRIFRALLAEPCHRLPGDRLYRLGERRQSPSALPSSAGGWYLSVPVEGERLTKGAAVLAAAPGAIDDLSKLAGL
ncbi:hypothetical protein GGE07_001317 [Sinorhizobium terangae]|nr:hypothetical protein [Sinorhizobium terangae]